MAGTSLLRPPNLSVAGLIPWATGRFYSEPIAYVGLGSQAIVDNLYTCPIFVPNINGVTITSLGIEVTTFANVSLRIGIYDMDEFAAPGKLILDAGTLSLASSNGFKSIGSLSQFLEPGWYFIVGVTNNITTAVVRAYSTSSGRILLMGTLEEQDSAPLSSWSIASGGVNSSEAIYNDGLPLYLGGILEASNGGTFPRFMVGI